MLPAFSGSTSSVVATAKTLLDQEEAPPVRSNGAASPIDEVSDARASRRREIVSVLPNCFLSRFPTEGGRGDIAAGICCERKRFTLRGNLSGGWRSSSAVGKGEGELRMKAAGVVKGQISAAEPQTCPVDFVLLCSRARI